MPATAQTLQYADLVTADVAVDNQVNLVDYDNFGHRVQISLAAADMNNILTWARAAGSSRPVAHFLPSVEAAFKQILVTSLNTSYTDVDAVASKLSYDSTIFNTNTDSRIRESGVSANDLVMAYVLYKVYGSSAVTTQEKVFNLEDAYGMLASDFLADRIIASFHAAEQVASSSIVNEKGAVDAMFRDLLASDPTRFFDSAGKQIPGLYETRADATSTGNWGLVADDVLEVRLEFTFQNKVTLRTTRDVSQALSQTGGAPADANKETIVINAGDKFNIRLQMKMTGGSASPPPPPPPPSSPPTIVTVPIFSFASIDYSSSNSSSVASMIMQVSSVIYGIKSAFQSGIIADARAAKIGYDSMYQSVIGFLTSFVNSGGATAADAQTRNDFIALNNQLTGIYTQYFA